MSLVVWLASDRIVELSSHRIEGAEPNPIEYTFSLCETRFNETKSNVLASMAGENIEMSYPTQLRFV